MNGPAPALLSSVRESQPDRLNVWVVRDLEPLPGDIGDRPLMRAGMLASELAEHGHETTWFTSNFDHYHKRWRPLPDRPLAPVANLGIQMLPGLGYSRNLGLRRILHNIDFARRWRRHVETRGDRPDLILTDIPTIETAAAVVAFGRAHGIPTLVSVRDTWPDSFNSYVPWPLHPLSRPGIAWMDRRLRYAARHAIPRIADGGLRRRALLVPVTRRPQKMRQPRGGAIRAAVRSRLRSFHVDRSPARGGLVDSRDPGRAGGRLHRPAAARNVDTTLRSRTAPQAARSPAMISDGRKTSAAPGSAAGRPPAAR